MRAVRPTFFAALCAALTAACAVGPVDRDRPTGAGCTDEPATVHDGERKARLTRALDELTTAGRTTTLGELADQLGRDRTDRFAPVTDAPRQPLAGQDIQRTARPSVVLVGKRYLCGKCDRWHLSTASGFVAAPGGVVCTSRHVLEGGDDSTFAVMTEDGRALPVVEVLAADDAADVALLRVDGELPPPLPLRSGAEPGEPVHVLSHPDGAFYYFTAGVLARRFPFRHSSGRVVEQLDLTAAFARGSSGAPVLDSAGAVIGVVRATDSVYYTEESGEQRDLQMVFRRATPVEALLGFRR